jgi:hypothetical protein
MRAIKVEYKTTPAGNQVFVARMKDLPPKQYEAVGTWSFESNMRDAAYQYLESLAADNESWWKFELGDGALLDEDTMVFIPQIFE